MKALFKSTKKHVIRTNKPTIHQRYTKTNQDDFLPIPVRDSEDDGTHSTFEKPTTKPFRTPPSAHKSLSSAQQNLHSDGATNRKNLSCPTTAASSPALSKKIQYTSFTSVDDLSDIKGTSFLSSSENLNASQNSISAFSFSDVLSSLPGNSRNSSLTSASLSQGSYADTNDLNLSTTSTQFHSSLAEEQLRNDTEQSNPSPQEAKSESQHNGIWKKLHFPRKEKNRHLKKENSKDDPQMLKPSSRAPSIDVENLGAAAEILEKFKEENEALEIEVRGKDEEVRMLNATIDQVNQTWENKVQAMMRDLEEAKRKNEHLRAKLSKETAASHTNTNKSALRIPVRQPQKVAAESSEFRNQMISNGDSPKPTKLEQVTSPYVKRKGIREISRRVDAPVSTNSKADDVKEKILKSLISSSCLSHLSHDALVSIADVMKSRRINRGERLMQEGTLGQGFYILAEGECRIYKQNQESISPNLSEGGRPISQWETFGETDVFYHTKRVWSCKCVRQGSIWYISRDEFKSTIMQQDIQRRKKEIYLCLKEIKSFQNLKTTDFKMLANVSRIAQYANGDYIIRQGSSPHSVYILKEGNVTITKIIDGSETRIETVTTGQILGTLTSSNCHQNNVVASGKEVVQCVAIPMRHFDKVRDRLILNSNDVTMTKVSASLARRDLLGDGQDSTSSGHTGSASSGYGSDLNSPYLRRRRVARRYDEAHFTTYAEKSSLLKNKTTEDFEILSLIGTGGFGTVNLVSLKNNDSNVFAIKQLSKYEVVASEQQQNVFSEKALQMDTSRDCPFVASLYSTFKDNRFVYFVMEYCPGGELFSLLSKGRSFHDDTARFYAGCVLEALSFLHARHIVFRDLKPENLVIDKDGYCKVTDFGFAKKVTAKSSMRTYTYCGTPEYMAPETILYQAQSFPVDIWSLGVFIFEILDGKAPFRNKNRVSLADSILAGIEPILQVSKDAGRIGKVAAALIKELCQVRPEDRLGTGRCGISEVGKHAWFSQFKWTELRQRKLPAPWTPKLDNIRDTRYFKPQKKGKYEIEDCEEFSGWDESF